jgi:hypothetical protein
MTPFPEYFADEATKARYLRALRENDAVVNLGNPNFYRLHLSGCRDIRDPDKNWNPKNVFATIDDAVTWLRTQSVDWADCGHCKPRRLRNRYVAGRKRPVSSLTIIGADETDRNRDPDQLDREIDALVEQGWYKSREQVLQEAVRRFLECHRAELMERFVREDVEWGGAWPNLTPL